MSSIAAPRFAPVPALAPPLRLLLGEVPGVMRLHLGRVVRHERADVGRGRPVLVLPGFLANDRSTRMLRAGLSAAGFAVYGWGQGRNRGIQADTLDRIEDRIEAIGAAHDLPVTIVGWSLGGLMAREYAKRAPDRIARVVTLGSPFSGDMRANNVWRLYEWVAGHPVDAPPIACRLDEKPPVDTVALWSRRDGVVHYRSTRGRSGEADRTVELDCNHLGFCTDARAIDAVIAAAA